MNLDIYSLFRQEIGPALGCTEPAAVALACAVAARQLQGTIRKVHVQTDPNVYKNGMGVYIPGTNKIGLVWAAALGVHSIQQELALQVLSGCSAHLAQAERLIAAGEVGVSPTQPSGKLAILARVETEDGTWAEVEIKGAHDRVQRIVVNGATILQQEETPQSASGTLAADLLAYPLEQSIAALLTLPQAAYDYLLECAHANQLVSQVGLNQALGLGIGWNLQRLMNEGLLGKDLANLAMAATAAAADARISGWDLPVFSTNGSGNQGLTASLPILTAAEAMNCSERTCAEALAISQLVTIYVKQHIGRLSAICACAVAASIGATCGIAHLRNQPFPVMEQAIKLMVANLTGLICDGGKVSCSIKLATAVSAAVQAALLAEAGMANPVTNGIVADSVEGTIRNLGRIGNPGMVETDRVILNVMVNHCQ